MGLILGSAAQPLYLENETSGSGITSLLLFPEVFSEEICNLFQGGPWKCSPVCPLLTSLKIWGAHVPYLTVGKIWKKYWGRGVKVDLSISSFIAVYRTIPVFPDIRQIRRINIRGNRVPQPPVGKIYKRYWVWVSMMCWSVAILVDLVWTVSELIDFKFFGNSPFFQNR